ncbi:Acyl-CoA N-acyltransferase [Penicillium griseofulvum]|uniref:Acyl-CoA N-acyltransferase n=1 Tax=Penicillium patulum TaxID=5078 RepID=A0A135LI12_PENPA|nr:Acyl-CoA N-acyltransferase [Penicillium griseofulvum]KXG48602.1 Acyl-CoA N-acyltransferase [Penicillium griseofulvum]
MARMVTSPCRGDSFTAIKPQDATSQKTTPHTSPSNSQGKHKPITSPGQSTDVATEDFEIISALKLIAVSVDQQRHIAAISLILHPTTMTLVAVSFAYSVGAVYHDPSGWPYIAIICATAILATLGVAIRLSWRYHDKAEKVGTLNWLYGHDPSKNVDPTTTEEDPAFNSDNGVTFVLIHRFGRRIVGALAMSVTYSGIQPHSEPSSTTLPTGENYNAFIRAWTVQKGFRGYGVGAALLNEAIMICYEHKWKRLRFATCHANSLRVFLPIFHSDMDQESAMWSSYLRKRTEAHRQSRAAFEARILHASLDLSDSQGAMIDTQMRLICTEVKVEELIRTYFNVRLEKAFEAQARWKKMS